MIKPRSISVLFFFHSFFSGNVFISRFCHVLACSVLIVVFNPWFLILLYSIYTPEVHGLNFISS